MKSQLTSLPLLVTLLALGACGGKDGESTSGDGPERTKSGDRSLQTKSRDRTKPNPGDPLNPSPALLPEGPDPSSLFAQLTADNALETRALLRSDPLRWKSVAGPFYRKWAALAPEAALAAAREEDPTLRLSATTLALAGWTATDPAMARNWFDSATTKPRDLRYAHALIDNWPAEDLSGLAAWTKQFEDGDDKSKLITRLALRWQRSSPDEAAQWLASLPAGEGRDQATDSLFRKWGREDPTAAGDYLSRNFNGSNREAAISAYAKAVVPDDAAGATLWAEEITSPRLREEILRIIPHIRSNPGGGPQFLPNP